MAIVVTSFAGAHAQSAGSDDLVVPVPTVPENLTRLDERCNFLVEKFWEHANLKSAFSSLDKMDATFGRFLAFTPYADAEVVHKAIDNLIAGVAKADARNLIKLARMADKWCGTDTAEYASEELYYPFVKAVATNKKVKDPEKARYRAIYQQLDNSRLGATVANFTFTKPDGTTATLDDIPAESILLLFYDPDCTDCRLAKARLASDFVLPTLIRRGDIAVLAIYPSEADDEWRDNASSMPEEWIIGAAPDIDQNFTITHRPEIYYLDKNHTVLAKGIAVDNAIAAFHSLLINSVGTSDPETTDENANTTRPE